MGTSGVRRLVLPPRSVATRQSDVRRMGHTSLSEMEVRYESLWAREAHLSPKLRSKTKQKPEISTRQGNQRTTISVRGLVTILLLDVALIRLARTVCDLL